MDTGLSILCSLFPSHSPGFGVALVWLWCGYQMALGWLEVAFPGLLHAFPATGRSWREGAPVSDPARLKRLRHAGSETGVPVARDRVPPP